MTDPSIAARTRRVLRARLIKRFGGLAQASRAITVSRRTLQRVLAGGTPSGRVALRLTRAADLPDMWALRLQRQA